MSYNTTKSVDLVHHLREALQLAHELKFAHLEYLLAMAVLESRDRLGETVSDASA
ncbi:hypothetical protein LPW26_17255 [Rhodopseudomonas sp. HC1]|uniref:hypothetical protein n=1 Tax=Rhodopseudomonas infernalis TaxID=2897386 RepID=UPI001EE99EFC|nr:hypothetical protein [Rhodopseudomonas infernalis]MCG6206399.1 hypothetical protein [Rhodopseudomonas infernalis]